MKPILVIEQEYSLRGLGLLGERLAESRLPYRSLRAWEEPIDELDPRDFAALIPMGGTAHAWQADDIPLLRRELRFLRDAVEAEVPVLGICLGGQLLARALGGEVTAAAEAEIGWLEITATDAARADPIFRILDDSAGVYQWHSDVFEAPPGANILARSEASPNQAFRMEGAAAWGIQFHPEATPELFELWIARHPVEVKESGVDVDALRAAVYAGAPESLAFCSALFDAFINVAADR
jgi:GMP synthase-like glutamine amidotransferase